MLLLELDREASVVVDSRLHVERLQRVDELVRPVALLQMFRGLRTANPGEAAIAIAFVRAEGTALLRVDRRLHRPVVCLEHIQLDAHVAVQPWDDILCHICGNARFMHGVSCCSRGKVDGSGQGAYRSIGSRWQLGPSFSPCRRMPGNRTARC